MGLFKVNSRLYKGVLNIVSGTMLAQILSILAMPILTRIYTPEDFGRFYLFSALLLLIAPVSALRIDQILMVSAKRERSRLLTIGVFSALVIAVAYVALLIMLAQFGMIDVESGLVFWLLLMFSIVISGWHLLIRQLRLRELNTKFVGRSAICKSVGKYGFLLPLSLINPQVAFMYLSEVVGGMSALLFLSRGGVKLAGVKFYRYFSIKYKNYIKFDLPASLLNSIALTIQIPVMSAIFGTAMVGYFSLAIQMAGLPNYHLGKAVADSFHAAMSAELDYGRFFILRGEYTRLTVRLCLLGGVVYVPAFFLAPVVFTYVFGSEWSNSGDIVRLVLPWLFFQLVSSPCTRVFLLLDAQRVRLVIDVLSVVLTISVFTLAWYFSFEFMDAIALLVVSKCCIYLSSVLLCFKLLSARLK